MRFLLHKLRNSFTHGFFVFQCSGFGSCGFLQNQKKAQAKDWVYFSISELISYCHGSMCSATTLQLKHALVCRIVDSLVCKVYTQKHQQQVLSAAEQAKNATKAQCGQSSSEVIHFFAVHFTYANLAQEDFSKASKRACGMSAASWLLGWGCEHGQKSFASLPINTVVVIMTTSFFINAANQ